MYLKNEDDEFIKINNNIIQTIIINLIYRLYYKNIRHRNLISQTINKEAKKQKILIYTDDKKYRSINTWIKTVFGNTDNLFKTINDCTTLKTVSDIQLI